MPIDLYHFKISPPSRAVRMCAKQLDLDVNLKHVDLGNGDHMKPEFLELNPAHSVPVIVDGDLTMWESRAILQYLANQYAPQSSLYPSDPKKRAVVDRILSFDSSYYSSILRAVYDQASEGREPTEQQIRMYKNNLNLMNTLIGNNDYVTGDEMTIADLSVLASTTVLELNDYKDLYGLPNLSTWFDRVREELLYFEEVNAEALGFYQLMKST